MSAARQPDSTAIQARAAKMRCLFPDIDGVMTDCKPHLAPEGEGIKVINVRAGRRPKAVMKNGIELADPILAVQGPG